MKLFTTLLCLCLTAAHAAKLRRIYQYPNGTGAQLENIAVRPNGSLIITTTSYPCIYTVNPKDVNVAPQQIHCFENATATLGIAEIFPDIFAFNVGTYSGQMGKLGTFSVWTIDFNQPSGPTIKLLTKIPEAHALNGMTAVRGDKNIFIADSYLGQVWRVETLNGTYGIAGKNPHFLPNSSFPLGINGIHADSAGRRLYFTNSANGTFGTAPLDRETGTFSGLEILAHVDPGKVFDDFALKRNSTLAYVTEHSNRIISIDLHTGQKELVAQGPEGDVTYFEPTSVALGRDECTLYVVSVQYIPSPQTDNGQVFEVDLC